jgi:membrane associated rhomboid family serine protease
MIPLRDENPTRSFPIVNYILIAINVIVFLFQLMVGMDQNSPIYEFTLIPAQITSGLDVGDITDIFTSMFMHGGWAHIIGNMLYLWIFGDNVEDAMGHVRYLLFYLAGGVVASLAHILSNPDSTLPTVGASGAIAAALGAYLILFPSSRVLTLIPLGFFMRLTMVPAIIVLGLWGILQLFQGFMSVGLPDDVGGVAFWAHIGGFVFGLALGKILGKATPAYRARASY